MKLHVFSLVIDGMKFLPMQLATMNRLTCDWHWSLVEGVAANVNCTKWCKRIPPRLSIDGTTQFLNSLRGHPRITVHQQQAWPGKNAMVNTALKDITSPCTLLQMDIDEAWTPDQLNRMSAMFERFPNCNCARFLTRYFIGINLVTVGDGYGNRSGEWVRAWRFEPGMRSISHEPPVMNLAPKFIDRPETERLGLVFDHLAYVFPDQLAFKQTYYGYDNALAQWQALQRYEGPWPITDLSKFLSWVPKNTKATRLFQ